MRRRPIGDTAAGFLLRDRNGACCGDKCRRIARHREVKELLCRVRELRAILRDEHEGSLHCVAAVLDGLLTRADAVNAHCLDVVLERCQRGIADGSRVLRDGGDDVAGGGQLLTVLAGVLRAGDRFKAVTRAGASLTANQDDLCILDAEVLPVGDLSGIDVGDLLHGEVGDRIVGVDNDGDAVKRDGRTDQTGALFIVLQRAAGQADVAAALMHGGDAGAGAGRVICTRDAPVVVLELLHERADDLFP